MITGIFVGSVTLLKMQEQLTEVTAQGTADVPFVKGRQHRMEPYLVFSAVVGKLQCSDAKLIEEAPPDLCAVAHKDADAADSCAGSLDIGGVTDSVFAYTLPWKGNGSGSHANREQRQQEESSH